MASQRETATWHLIKHMTVILDIRRPHVTQRRISMTVATSSKNLGFPWRYNSGVVRGPWAPEFLQDFSRLMRMQRWTLLFLEKIGPIEPQI